MKERIKRMGVRLLSRPPFSTALRFYALRGNPITILCYHTLRPASETLDAWTVLSLEDFRDQVSLLRLKYEIVSLDEALERRGQPGRPRVVLTFDDGEWGLYAHLLPVIKTEGIPVTVFVATNQIETGMPYWFDRVMNALQVEDQAAIDLNIAGISNWQINAAPGKARWAQIASLLEALKLEPDEERNRLADLIVVQAGLQANGFTPLRPLTLAQLKDLATNPLVTIGAHSHGHELLDQLPVDVAGQSILRSKVLLEEWTGEEVRHFAYPNGNYSADLMTEIARLGFASATILGERLVTTDANLFALPRIGVGRYDMLSQFKLGLTGLR